MPPVFYMSKLSTCKRNSQRIRSFLERVCEKNSTHGHLLTDEGSALRAKSACCRVARMDLDSCQNSQEQVHGGIETKRTAY